MKSDSNRKWSSIFSFVVALFLLSTGIVALPIGLFLIVLGEIMYGAGAVLYGAVAVGVAMYGSNRTVLLAAGSLIWPIFPWRRKR